MGTATDFLTSFYNLDGLLLKDQKKSLFKLLKSYEKVDNSVIDEIIFSLKTHSFREEIYKLEILIFFKKSNELFKILKQGNDIATYKSIKHPWFVNDILNNLTANQLADVLPNLSASARCKFLKKILLHVKNEETINLFYDSLLKKYGFKTALILFGSCSVEKIKSILLNNHLKLTSNHLKSMFHKDPKLIEFYFEEYKKNGGSVEYYHWESFFRYIQTKDLKLLLELAKKYDFYIGNCGKMTTKKIMATSMDEINNKPFKYMAILNTDVFVRKMGKDFPTFYKKLFPKKMSDLSYYNEKSLKVIKSYPKKLRYQLYLKTFEECYNKSLWDNVKYMDQNLIEFAPTKEEKDKWIEKFDNRTNFKKYQVGEKCAAMAYSMDDAEFMMRSDNPIREQKTVFNSVVSTCKLTQDYEALLNVLKSFLERHRHSIAEVIYNFLRNINEEMKMEKLTREHWDIILEIINIQKFKKMPLYVPIIVEYCKFLFHNGGNVDEYVILILKEIPNLTNLKYNDDDFQKMMIGKYIEHLNLIEDKENKLGPQIILCISEWNKHHSHLSVDVKCLKDSVKKMTINEDTDLMTIKAFEYILCNQTEENYDIELEEKYWNNIKHCNSSMVHKWFVKYKPNVFETYLNCISFLAEDKNVVHNMKKYNNLSEKITQFSLNKLDDKTENVDVYCKLLALFQKPIDFISLFKKFIPTEVNISMDEKSKFLYDTQLALLKSCKYCSEHANVLNILLKYCKRDYMRSSLPSLYSKIYKIPENDLPPILNEIDQLSVSIRKHSIYFSSRFLPFDQVISKYRSVQSDEKNDSIKRHLFINSYRYFLKNGSDECWDIVQNYMDHIKRNDKYSIELLTEVNRISPAYRSRFVEKSWSVLEKLESEGGQTQRYLSDLIYNLDAVDMKLFNNSFCINVIDRLLFDEYKLSGSIFTFAFKFMLYGGDVKENVASVFLIIEKFKGKYLNTENKYDAVTMLHDFVCDIFRNVIENTEKLNFSDEFFKEFYENWKNIFTITETFEEHIMAEMMGFRRIKEEENHPEFVKEMLQSLNHYINKFGKEVLFIYQDILERYLSYELGYRKDTEVIYFKIYNEILKQNSSAPILLLVGRMMDKPKDDEAKKLYYNLIERLNCENEIVKIHCWRQIKNQNIE